MLYPKPSAISRVGLVQFFLASAFVLWLLLFPETGRNFAWPITPAQSARFIGASFLLRAFFGWHLWRQKDWLYLRWSRWGNFAFLAILFLATFWHIDQMNWQSNIMVAHIWVLAYTAEPLVLWLVEPRAPESEARVPASLSEGAVLPGLKNLFMFMFVVGMGLGAILFIHPGFADTRWPWALTEFDSRVMAAWPVAIGVFSATMYFAEDWAEIKVGVQTILVVRSRPAQCVYGWHCACDSDRPVRILLLAADSLSTKVYGRRGASCLRDDSTHFWGLLIQRSGVLFCRTKLHWIGVGHGTTSPRAGARNGPGDLPGRQVERDHRCARSQDRPCHLDRRGGYPHRGHGGSAA